MATRGGIIAGALALDATNAHVDMSNPTAFRLTGAMTISAWVQPAANHDGAILSKEAGGTDRGYMLRFAFGAASSFGHFAVYSDCTLAGQVDANGTTDLANGEWHHLAGVFRPSAAVELYVDGVLDAAETSGVPATHCDPPVNVNLGQRPNGTFPLSGIVDDVRLYDRALALAEITELFACR